MATYFHVNSSSEIQGADHHGMQTLYLMNPVNNYVPNYSDTTLLLNPAVNGLNPSNLPHAPPLMGIPLPAGPTKNVVTLANSEDINNRSSSLHGSLFSGNVHYDLWGSINQHHPQQIASLHPAATTDVYSTQPCRQGNLSLSLLSPKQAAYNNIEARVQQVSVAAATGNNNSPSSVSVVSNVVISESKYMRAAQELLDQVVNVLNVVKAQDMIGKEKLKLDKESTALNYAEGSINNNNNNNNNNINGGGGELTAAQKQELQLKKAKLVNMLDELGAHHLGP